MESGDQPSDTERSDHAVEWLARLRATDVTAAEKAEFAEWLAHNPLNKVAFDEITELWHQLGHQLPELEFIPVPRRRRTPLHWSLAAAATVLIAAILTLTQFTDDRYETHKGEQARIVLDDGSVAFLNTDSKLTVSFSARQRRVQIGQGEVWFDVEPDAERPFFVVGGFATAKAVGTAFTVRESTDFTRIRVTEGVVALTPQTAALETSSRRLRAGEEGTASSATTVIAPFDADTELSWQRGQLVYRDVRLADLLEDLNRYLPRAMTVNDPSLSAKRVSAVLNLDDQDAMLEALGKSLPIRWKAVSDALIIITPSS